MNPMDTYAQAMRPFTQPYLAMMEAYAGFLKQVGGSKAAPVAAEPVETASPPPAKERVPRRAQAFAAARDDAKRELTPQTEAPVRSAKKVSITHAAAVERARRAWVTRRANAAQEEKSARKAARQKARSGRSKVSRS